jgi:hypothetical protein
LFAVNLSAQICAPAGTVISALVRMMMSPRRANQVWIMMHTSMAMQGIVFMEGSPV